MKPTANGGNLCKSKLPNLRNDDTAVYALRMETKTMQRYLLAYCIWSRTRRLSRQLSSSSRHCWCTKSPSHSDRLNTQQHGLRTARQPHLTTELCKMHSLDSNRNQNMPGLSSMPRKSLQEKCWSEKCILNPLSYSFGNWQQVVAAQRKITTWSSTENLTTKTKNKIIITHTTIKNIIYTTQESNYIEIKFKELNNRYLDRLMNNNNQIIKGLFPQYSPSTLSSGASLELRLDHWPLIIKKRALYHLVICLFAEFIDKIWTRI